METFPTGVSWEHVLYSSEGNRSPRTPTALPDTSTKMKFFRVSFGEKASDGKIYYEMTHDLISGWSLVV